MNSTAQPVTMTFMEFVSEYTMYNKIEDTSTKFFEATKNLRNFSIGEDGVTFWSGNDQIPVTLTDTEGAVLYINVYVVDRAYGGPEEGGWYYTYYQSEEVVPVLAPEGEDIFEYAKKELAKWRERYSNEGRRPISSSLSEGEYEVRLEVEKKESETRETPRYC